MYTDEEILSSFYTGIYSDSQGVICIGTKNADTKQFLRYYFNWPIDKQKVVEFTLEHKDKHDVYFTPALFDSANSTMEHVVGANCFWVELDNEPNESPSLPPPTLKIQSSTGKFHWYWQLEGLVSTEKLNQINKSLGFILNADDSGWDATQILRPPQTLNHKYDPPLPVSLEQATGNRYLTDALDWLPEAPKSAPTEDIKLEKVPALEELIFKYKLPKVATDIFSTGKSSSEDRSDTLMQLAYELAKAEVAVEDMLCMLIHLDNRIGKFAKRDDQLRQLTRIISIARNKYPVGTSGDLPKFSAALTDFGSILNLERTIEWAMEGLVESNGNAMVTGMPGIGKTQFTLQAAAHIAIGKNFLGFQVKRARKVVFISLEMDDIALKAFLVKQATAYTDEERVMLNTNFKILAFGQSLHLNYKAQQDLLDEFIVDNNIEGIFIDSLSMATDKALQDEVSTRSLMGWVNKLRTNRQMFVWWIHHNRKPSGDNKKPKELGDIYGSVFISTALTSAFVLWPSNEKHTIELSFVKTRLAERPDPCRIHRDKVSLTFSKHNVTVVDEQSTEDPLGNFQKFITTNRTRTNKASI